MKLDVKKSSFKKINAFLSEMSQSGAASLDGVMEVVWGWSNGGSVGME